MIIKLEEKDTLIDSTITRRLRIFLYKWESWMALPHINP